MSPNSLSTMARPKCPNEPTQNAFQTLVTSLGNLLGSSSGIDSSDVDANELQKLMEHYISNETEWNQYFFPAPDMNYTRNLVDKGNGKSNLVCINSVEVKRAGIMFGRIKTDIE
jgi:hypothetical protein